MSLWGATVITNLFGVIPKVGDYVVIWLWGGFYVSNPTLKRFFILHFVLPFILAVITLIHLVLLHLGGSTNPLGVSSGMDYLRFYPKFIIKDIFGWLVGIGGLVLFTVFWYPNALGHPDNYIRADKYITPEHIVPEWYFLPFYAILRSIPHKVLGVVAMFASIIILFFLPFLGNFKCKSDKFSKHGQFFFWAFVGNFLLLGWLGTCIVEQPFLVMSQISAVAYFMYFLVIVPTLSILEVNIVENRKWQYKKRKKIIRLGRKINYLIT